MFGRAGAAESCAPNSSTGVATRTATTTRNRAVFMIRLPPRQPNRDGLIVRHSRAVSLRHDGFHDLFRELRLINERLASGLLALANQFTVELEPGAFLFHHAMRQAYIDDAAFLVDSVIVNDFDLRF